MFDSTGAVANTELPVPVRETDSNHEPVHGSAKLSVVVVRSPSCNGSLVPEGTSSGRALFFFTAPSQCARDGRRWLSPQPASSCREPRARCGGEASTSQGGVATEELLRGFSSWWSCGSPSRRTTREGRS